ncbi:TPA: hypothetical protein ACS3GH_000693 [Serratia marcescens]
MHRIDTPTAQIDKFGPGKNGFTNGDPATGRRATDLNSDMWDAVQEEMANAIEGNGIALDKSKHNQLYLAIQKAITDPGFLKKVNNLSDLANVAEARGNLQLGTAATKNVGTEGGNVMAVGAFGLGGRGFEFNYANNADLMVALRANGSCFFRNNRDGTGLSSWSPSVYCRAGDANGVLSINPFTGNVVAMGFTDSNTTAPKVNTLYGTTNKPTAADVGAFPLNGGNVGKDGVVSAGDIKSDRNNIIVKQATRAGGDKGYFIQNGDGVNIAFITAYSDGSVRINSLVQGDRNLSFNGRINSDQELSEAGQRVYSPNNPQPAVQLNQDNIGSLAFARLNPQNTSTGYGGFVSGGDLSPAGVTGYPGGGNWAAIYAQGTTLPGTWKCLGQCISDTEGSNRHFGASLFVRVS